MLLLAPRCDNSEITAITVRFTPSSSVNSIHPPITSLITGSLTWRRVTHSFTARHSSAVTCGVWREALVKVTYNWLYRRQFFLLVFLSSAIKMVCLWFVVRGLDVSLWVLNASLCSPDSRNAFLIAMYESGVTIVTMHVMATSQHTTDRTSPQQLCLV